MATSSSVPGLTNARLWAVLGSLLRVPRRRDLTWLSLGLVAGVVAQIILGAIVVIVELDPVSVIGHFLVSMVLVWIAVVLHERGRPVCQRAHDRARHKAQARGGMSQHCSTGLVPRASERGRWDSA